MKRRIVPGGILALSLAVVLLAATASTASASTELGLWCAPLPTPLPPMEQIHGGCFTGGRFGRGSFHFGARQVGTTRPAQGFALGVIGRGQHDTFNPKISVSSDYAQTNNCPPTLLHFEGCLIAVTFAPTSTGPKKGTLSTGPGGPTATLTGNGVTTATPWDWPVGLEAFADELQKLRRSGVVKVGAETNIGHCVAVFPGCPHYDTRVVLRGDVKKTTKRLEANRSPRTIRARLKHLKQLRKEPTAPKIKIKIKATDEFGQTATKSRKVKLCRRIVHVSNEVSRCVWHSSRK